MCYCVFRKTCKFAITQYVIARPAHAYSLDSSGQRDRVYYTMHAWYMIMSRPVSVFACMLDSPSTSITTVSTVLSKALVRLLHNVLWESPHSRRGERKLCSEFQDVLSESLVDVGYFDGKQSIKMSLMSKQDIAAMY